MEEMTRTERVSLSVIVALMIACLMTLISMQANAATTEDTQDTAEHLFNVMPADAEHAIALAMQEQGIADKVDVKLTSEHGKVLFSNPRPMEIGVKTLRYDEQRQSWSGNLFVFEKDRVLTALPLSGRYDIMAEVPVLKTKMRQGDVISKEDIDYIDYPQDKIRKDTIETAAQLIGKTPHRSISDGRPVRLSELQDPFVIERDAQVEMRFSTPHMTISALGEALEPGAVGQFIRVRNQDSNSIVHAKVISATVVEVRGATPLGHASVASR